ncbi:MAG: 3-methyl-2-oxobutanoate hydroxymethyltransferase, partial [Deltaproteobacteria bacterium]|nr:3-methyl-2-oxobutanoate hydroxymethyltransferase [Deltaproteobacteria bacterium]
GDSLGMVVQGHANTLPVTIDDVIYHTRAVARARCRAHLVADMPFMSYQVGVDQALRNAGRLLAEAGAESVKLEGGSETAATVQRLVQSGIPVMGHVGLTPQSVHALGGFVVQGKTDAEAQRLLDSARRLEDAGCYSIVIESVPALVGEAITSALSIPTIGIGAGPDCDGQVLVCYDLIGLNPDFKPRFVKRFAEVGATVREAVASFADEVRRGVFPDASHCFESKLLTRAPVPADDTEAEVLALYGTVR